MQKLLFNQFQCSTDITHLHPCLPACIVEPILQAVIKHNASLDATAPELGPVTCLTLSTIRDMVWDAGTRVL